MNMFIKYLEAFESTSKELNMYQNLVSPNIEHLRQEYTLLNREQTFINKIKEDLQYYPPSVTPPTMMSSTMFQGYQQQLI